MQVRSFISYYSTFPSNSNSASLMMKFTELIRTRYGGARQWFGKYCQLTEEELDLIRTGLIVESNVRDLRGLPAMNHLPIEDQKKKPLLFVMIHVILFCVLYVARHDTPVGCWSSYS